MTVVESLRHGEEFLRRGPHPERARPDAELLLLHVLDKNRAWCMAHGEDELTPENAAVYTRLIERRILGEPVQYIVGLQEFFGLPFLVSSDVLIPRPETEHLVEKTLDLAAELAKPRILDVGTGSGAIAVVLAHKLPNAHITAVDVSSAALAVARENSQRNGVADRVRFLQSELLSAIAHERFHLVVSNPPYIPILDRDSLSVEVRDHEPSLALFAGEDGLDIYRQLIPDAYAALEPGGYLLLEIGFGQSASLAPLLRNAGFEHIEFVPDLQGIPRVTCAQRIN